MAADLHIHVMDDVTEDDLRMFFSNTLGSKWFDMTVKKSFDSPEYKRVMDSPSVWIGEVSWLKAGLFEDEDEFIPGPVEKVSEIVGEDLPVIDDEFIVKIEEALHEPNMTQYSTTKSREVLEFLDKYRGKRVFTVSW